jgi:hypothetical protein
MANRKPLLMNKELYNFLNNGTNKPESKNMPITSETPENMLKTLQGIFCKGRYQSWILSPKNPHPRTSKNKGKTREK